jgi:hypothetical protein
MYCSQNNVSLDKSRKLRLAGHVMHMEKMRDAYKILVGKSKGRRPLGIDWKIIL